MFRLERKLSSQVLTLLALALSAAAVTSCGPDYESLNKKSDSGKEYVDMAQWVTDVNAAGLSPVRIKNQDSELSKKADFSMVVEGLPQIVTVDIFPGATAADTAEQYAEEYLKSTEKLSGADGQILTGPNWTVSSVNAAALQAIQSKLGGDIKTAK